MSLQLIETLSGNLRLETQSGIVNLGGHTETVNVIATVKSMSGSKIEMVAEVLYKAENVSFIRSYLIPLSVSDESANFIRQAYLHLKTLPEFASATDC
jgi:hypothetical protein